MTAVIMTEDIGGTIVPTFEKTVTISANQAMAITAMQDQYDAAITDRNNFATKVSDLEKALENTADKQLMNAVENPVPLDRDIKQMTYDVFQIMKGYLNKKIDDKPKKLGLSVFILDMDKSSKNIYNNDGNNRILGQFETKPNVYSNVDDFKKVLEAMVNEDYAIVVDKNTGDVEVCKAKINGDSTIADPNDIYNDSFNGRCSAGLVASYFGTSITLRNYNKQLFALHDGKVINANVSTPSGRRINAPLNYVPKGVKDTVPKQAYSDVA